MKKYGFFGGSFNPITNAHIQIALNILKRYNLDKIIFVPVGNNYQKAELIDEKHRYNMIKIAIQDYKTLQVSDIELNSKKDYKAIDIFKIIKQKYVNTDIFYIIGADNLYKMPSWKEFEKLVTYNYIIIERGEFDCNKLINSNEILKENKNNFNIIENSNYYLDSSTDVRKKIIRSDIKNIEKYIDTRVMDYIIQNNLYKDIVNM